MKAVAGLRTEVIVNLSLLMAAALLFGGLLLLKQQEREALTLRVKSIAASLEQVSRMLPPSREGAAMRQGAERLLGELPREFALQEWTLEEGGELSGAQSLDRKQKWALGRARLSGETQADLVYRSGWFADGEEGGNYVRITVPVRRGGRVVGALQGTFSLAAVEAGVAGGRRVILLYGSLYAALWVLFGLYLLGRTVVNPVRRLERATSRVAAGDLETRLPESGPREIREVAGSFNLMVAALKESRQSNEEAIDDLRRANEELRRTQAELIRSERMASVGHLAAGMAHEIGNPLGAMVGYVGFLRQELPPQLQSVAERALEEAGRIDRLVKDLLDYSAPTADGEETFDPAAALREASSLLVNQGALGEGRVEDCLPAALPAVWCSRHKLLQVFVNLLLNARDAGGEGGAIRLEGEVRGEEVALAVSDRGEGIAPEVLPHLFDPFYTTKPPGRGRGLGLTVCHRIVSEAGGRIEVESEAGQGARFTVLLPMSGEAVDGI